MNTGELQDISNLPRVTSTISTVRSGKFLASRVKLLIICCSSCQCCIPCDLCTIS